MSRPGRDFFDRLREIPDPPSVAEMLAAVQKIDPSAKLGLSVHDECWILCAPHKAQACQDAVLSLVLARWCAPIVADASPTDRK